jgi:hypothetical protein
MGVAAPILDRFEERGHTDDVQDARQIVGEDAAIDIFLGQIHEILFAKSDLRFPRLRSSAWPT